MDKEKALSLWEQVKIDNRKWEDCHRHFFPHIEQYIVGRKITCSHCGVSRSLVDVGNYVRGYEAAGGDASDVWPDWAARHLNLQERAKDDR